MPDMPNPAFGPTTAPTPGAPFSSNYPAPARTKKWPWLVAAVLGGIAVGSAAYRFGFSGMGMSGGNRGTMLLAIMIIAASAASRVVRMNRSEMTPAPIPMIIVTAILGLVFGAAISVAIAPPLGYQMLTVRQLPGFSIALPGGEETASPSTYSQGDLELLSVGGRNAGVSVHWQIGDFPDDDVVAIIARSIASAGRSAAGSKSSKDTAITPANFPLEAALASPTQNKSIEFPFNDEMMARFTVVECGGRMVMITTMSTDSDGGKRLHARIVRSLHCTPDPTQNVADAPIPLVMELPGWHRQDLSRGQLTITNDVAAVLAVPLTIEPKGDVLDRVAGPLLQAIDPQLHLTGAGTDELRAIAGSVGGDVARGWVHPVACGDARGWLLLAYLEPGTGDASHRDELMRARCAKVGEKPTEWPAAPNAAPALPAAPATK